MTIASDRRWLSRLAIGLVAILPASAVAQVVAGPAAPASDSNDPVERLGVSIRALAASPRDLGALLSAGHAALDVGDPNAALGFFARAEEVAPNNAEAKAGLGSSLVMIERPDDALRLFGQAVSLGAREETVAKDRGLAYDLRGDNARAQRDYALALKQGPDEEVTRRYALSLGISGDRAGATAMLDPLLRRQDQAAWRARAFILAMTGDLPGANGVTRSLMSDRMASAMAPLLARLATLNRADRAHAVNFGSVPSDGTQLALVETGDPFLAAIQRPPAPAQSSPSNGLIPKGEPLGPREAAMSRARPPAQSAALRPVPSPAAKPVGAASSIQPPAALTPKPSGQTSPIQSGARLDMRLGRRIGPVDPARLPPELRGEPAKATIVGRTDLPPPAVAPAKAAAAPAPLPLAVAPARIQPPLSIAGPPAASGAPVAASQPVAPVTSRSRLAGLLAGLQTEAESAAVELPSARELRAARAAAKRKMDELAAQRAAEDAAKAKAAAEAAAAKRNPARAWVQVATGSNDRGLATTWKRIRSANETTLKGQSGWSVPYKATNRVLVGPMKSAAAARELVNTLAKRGVSATLFTSDAGQEIEKIEGR